MVKNLYLYSLYTWVFIFSLNACSHKPPVDTPGEKSGVQPQQVYTIPSNKPLSEKEKHKLRRQCGLFYDTMLKSSGFNGGIIVAKGGNIIFEKYQGAVTPGGADQITATTPLHVASVTKTFTAMAILKLQEEGKLNIDDSFTRFFPEFNYPGITLKTLLNHRSGLPNYLYFMKDTGWNEDSVIENKDVLHRLISKKDLIKNIGTPDTKFNYCNTNYVLLALVIEKISGKPYPQYMKETVFEPIGLNNTFIHYAGDNRIRTKSFDWRGGEIPDNFLDAVYGDKNMYSTPQDLLKWDRILSDTGFLSAKSMQMAYVPYSNERPGVKNYGLGWRLSIYPDNKTIIFHNGWWHGNNAVFIRLLKHDATIICMSNRYTRSVYKAKYLVNLFDYYFDTEAEEREAAESVALPDTSNGNKKLKVSKRKK